jgi:hypothetical protein
VGLQAGKTLKQPSVTFPSQLVGDLPQKLLAPLDLALGLNALQTDLESIVVQRVGQDADADTLYDAGCVFALAAGGREEAGGGPKKEECARRAVALLRQAVANGFKDAAHLKEDKDLDPLRGRDDFKRLLAEVEAAAKPEQKKGP